MIERLVGGQSRHLCQGALVRFSLYCVRAPCVPKLVPLSSLVGETPTRGSRQSSGEMEVTKGPACVAGASPTLLMVQDLVQALGARSRGLQVVEDGPLDIQEISGVVEAFKVWWEGTEQPASEPDHLVTSSKCTTLASRHSTCCFTFTTCAIASRRLDQGLLHQACFETAPLRRCTTTSSTSSYDTQDRGAELKTLAQERRRLERAVCRLSARTAVLYEAKDREIEARVETTLKIHER